MIDIVINYDKQNKEYRLYEPTTDTMIITANLSETFIKLSEFLVQTGMIAKGDILNTDQITYHLDSGTLISMVESNVNLMKRLTQQAPSIFTASAMKFGNSTTSSPVMPSQQYNKRKDNSKGGDTSFQKSNGTFSKSSFKSSGKRFGSK